MKTSLFCLIFIAATFALWADAALAQSGGDGWRLLFNGKDLSGWRELNGKHKWEVKDGMIVGTDVHGQPNGFLCTEEDFGDFILELDVAIDSLMNNSGVQFRTRSTADYLNGRVHGYQMEIDSKPQRWSGSIYDEGGQRGWLYTTELNVPGKAAFKVGEWNKYRIECFGTTIRTWINGVPISHLVDDESLKGFIGLQLHANNPDDPPGGNQVRFRNIRIKITNIQPSPPDEIFVVNFIPNNLSFQEKKTGYSLLWDGKSHKGWKDAYAGKFPAGSWEIKDSALSVSTSGKAAAGGRDIITRKKFGAFVLKFDFKLTEGANSGIKYFVSTTPDRTRVPDAVEALEFQIADDLAAGVTGKQTLGSLTDLLQSEKTRSSIKGRGEWNQGVIKAFPDNRVEYWLNGYKILEYKRGSAEYRRLVAQSKYKDIPDFGMAPEGHILLEGRGGKVFYRSIKIKEFDK